jgi:protein-arginine kinase activator protein McsA
MVFIRRSGGAGEGCDIVHCEDCAKSRGINAGKGGLDLNIDDLIGNGLDLANPRSMPAACPGCGLELSDLLRGRRLGCAACADAFHEEIARALGRRLPLASSEDLSYPEIAPPEPSPGILDTSKIEAELQSALASEDYERAAQLRDTAGQALAFPADFPIPLDSFSGAGGNDDDVVLWSSAKVFRDIEGLTFPGSPKGSPAPSRAMLLGRLLSEGTWRARSMPELGAAARRSLAERGI